MQFSTIWLYFPQRVFVIEGVFDLVQELLTVNRKTTQCSTPRQSKNWSRPAFDSYVRWALAPRSGPNKQKESEEDSQRFKVSGHNFESHHAASPFMRMP